MPVDLGAVSASIKSALHGVSSRELAVVPGAALFLASSLFLAFGSDQALAALIAP